VQACVAGRLQRLDRAGAQRPVLPDERAVEVRRDDAGAAREVFREIDQPV
jgi:hypothetical protein